MSDQDEQLIQHIVDIRNRLSQGEYDSEAAVSNGVVKRLLEAVGWPRYDQQVVRHEFPIETRKVDFALCDPPGEPRVLIEVKAVGSADQKGEDQLFQYCFRRGVKLAILTDGRTWKFYFPYGGGEYSDRLFRSLDIAAEDDTTTAETFMWFLAIDAVKSGVTFDRCEEAYAECQSQRRAAEAFGSVWNSLLCGSDKGLVDIFARKVEEDTGIRPKQQTVVEFIRRQATQRSAETHELTGGPSQSETSTIPSSPFYRLNGITVNGRTARDVYVGIFRKFAEQDTNFCQRYDSTQKKGGKRLQLARRAEDLYPAGSKLAQKEACELPGGWWLATNLDNDQKKKRIQRACDVMGIKYGRELIVSLSK